VAVTERLTFNPGNGLGPQAPSLDSHPPVDPAAPIDEPAIERPVRRDWAFFFMMAFTAVVFVRPQDSFQPLQLLHLAELFALAGLTAMTTGRLARSLPITRITPELVGVVALGGIMLVTAPFSIWMGGSVGVFREIFSKVILIYLLLINVLTSPRRVEKLTWLIVLATGYLGFRAVFDYVRGVNLVANERVHGAVSGIFGNPNDLALNMVALLPLAIFTMLRPGSVVKRASAGVCALFMLGAIVASQSRAGTLGLVSTIAVLAWFAIQQRPGFVIGGALAATLVLPILPANYWERMASIADASKDDHGSREARKTLFRESFQAFAENPLTGVGAGQFKNWNPEGREVPWHESHDVLLQVAAELGIGGVVVFSYLIVRGGACVRSTRKALRRVRDRSGRAAATARARARSPIPQLAADEISFLDAHSAAMAASLVGWFVCALFASVAYNWTFYYLLALAAAPRAIVLERTAIARASARKAAKTQLRLAEA
jgi:putative inorganic carbon (HCO3(-)) transporter